MNLVHNYIHSYNRLISAVYDVFEVFKLMYVNILDKNDCHFVNEFANHLKLESF